MFSDETFHPETATTNMTYGSFHQERESTAIEFDFLFVLYETGKQNIQGPLPGIH